MKRTAIALTLIVALSFSEVAGTHFVNVGKANPWIGFDWVSPKVGTNPPAFTISSPQENRVLNSSTVFLNFTSTVGESNASYTWLMQVYYKADWQQDEICVYNNTHRSLPFDPSGITVFSHNTNLTGVPEGEHAITFRAVERGSYINVDAQYFEMFDIDGFFSVNFTIDMTQPIIAVSSLENKTYETSDIPLNFTINEPVSEITYSLDGQENVTVSGNATLTGLVNGEHNVTLYATDEAGNVGTSENVIFSVAKPELFPTVLVVPASVASIAVIIGVGLLVYFKKRKRNNEPKVS